MKRELIKTEDGSHTYYVPELGEHYHSIHGAITESEHIYLKAGFDFSDKNPVRVLEYGMGTGLNVLLTFIHALQFHRHVFYHAIEKYPLTKVETDHLNLAQLINHLDPGIFQMIHDAPWESVIPISDSFSLYKVNTDFREAKPDGLFDVIYYDAFAPEVQPELWSCGQFEKVFYFSAPGAVLTTYSSKGVVRRNLQAAGFTTEKLPGPPGKREFIRAVKYNNP
jgi:tRNA U34 5-methylaminomethyl-2-thiouridine-forming methyltransferase MnmC